MELQEEEEEKEEEGKKPPNQIDEKNSTQTIIRMSCGRSRRDAPRCGARGQIV